MFYEVPGIVSKTGLKYEISDEWIVESVSKKGKRKILKPDKGGQVNLAGKYYAVYGVAKLAGLEAITWPNDEREWEELTTDSHDRYGFRYRIFEDGCMQRMDQHGTISVQTWTKNKNGYYDVCVAGKQQGVHQVMGNTRFVPKPMNMPLDWTVHHIDNDPSNNHYKNLEWASLEKQARDRRSKEQPRIVSYPVIGTALSDITLKDGTVIKKGEEKLFDNTDIAINNVNGGNQSLISACINGKRNYHADFTWKTPPSDPEFENEVFISIGTDIRSERFVSNHGRVKYTWRNGYSKILFAKGLLTYRQLCETDSYPRIRFGEKQIVFHRVIVEMFFGPIPKTIKIDDKRRSIVVDHIDNDKSNACLDNLQLLTHQENAKKRYLTMYKTSVASSCNGEYEYHASRADAIDYVRNRGYLEAMLDELNTHVNTPNKVYGRTWIRAHFEAIK